MRNRKHPPAWNPPAELWHMALSPDWILFAGKPGVGNAKSTLPCKSAQAAELSELWAQAPSVDPRARRQQSKWSRRGRDLQ
eukprot:8302776-Heterocapsa_arctica.AAC.1